MDIIEFRKNHKHLNCSECLLHFGNHYYDLDLSQTALRAMAGFGGGMFEGDLCGVVSGGISVISMVLTKERAYASPDLSQAIIAFKKRIRDAFGSIECRVIKPIHRDYNNGCDEVIIKACKLIIDVINDFE